MASLKNGFTHSETGSEATLYKHPDLRPFKMRLTITTEMRMSIEIGPQLPRITVG